MKEKIKKGLTKIQKKQTTIQKQVIEKTVACYKSGYG